MRLTFVLPDWVQHPIGGYKIAYEYATRLAARGHEVTVVHARPPAAGLRARARNRARRSLLEVRGVGWFSLPPSVKIVLATMGDTASLPPGDAIVATAWVTARFVSEAPASRGRRYYLIQHYETWDAPASEIDATWRLPMRKIVIARWLFANGVRLLGSDDDLRYIPNAIDTDEFKVIVPIADRDPFTAAMLYHPARWKGTQDGLDALEMARERAPTLSAILFGTPARPPDLPPWITYRRSPVGSELCRLYNSVAIFIHPSHAEGWPLPPAEAMASGCALVAATNPGVMDYTRSDRNALTASVGNPAGLAAQLTRVATEDSLRLALANQGVSDMKGYTWSRAVDGMEAVLAEVVP